jgi:hypothetical protein
MTICTSVKVRDGIVLGTDSMTQIHASFPDGRMAVAKTYSNARKLFQVANLPMGVMTWGAGNVGQRSIEGLLLDFSRSMKGTRVRAVRSVSNRLSEFLLKIHANEFKGIPIEQQPGVGLFVAGYSSKVAAFAEEWEFKIPADPNPKPVRPKDSFGASWRGVDIPFTRLYFGFDSRLREALINAGLDPETVKAVFDRKEFRIQVIYGAMPVQDAIDFVAFVLNTTIGYTSIEMGPPSCGGPLQVAVVLPQTGFSWLSQPTYKITET